MTSTAKPPDPMTCATGSGSRRALCRKPCFISLNCFMGPVDDYVTTNTPVTKSQNFRDQSRMYAGHTCSARASCRVRLCGVGGRRESERLPGCREAVTDTAGRRSPWVECCLRRGGTGGGSQRVGEWWAGRCGVFQRCGVGYAWTLGLVRRPVSLLGMLLP